MPTILKGVILFLLSFGLQFFWIKLLKKKAFLQKIYNLSPASHQEKVGTPSFGGLVIVLSLGLGLLLFRLGSIPIFWLYGMIFSFTGLGFLDDLLSQRRSRNKGLSVKQKFFSQLLIASSFLGIYFLYLEPFSWLSFFFYLFVIVGSSNACNLSDGLDGLLAGLSLFTLFGFYWVFVHFGLQELSLFTILFGLCIAAFLCFNFHPAKIFMGDTGSLALGAGFAGMALILKMPWILVPFGAVYILETFSVIIQVAYYKQTGKRFFKMAPLHHHFELLGLSELQVVLLFWGFGFFFMILGISQW